jgi:ABC-type transport system involved in multi-copper enzyme maturation permease subunit
MNVIASEWLKVRHRRLTWILMVLVPVVLTALYALLFVGIATADQSPGDTAEWEARLSLENVVTFGDAMVYRLVALFCIVLAGSVTANEFGWRTILTVTTWSGDRRSLLAGKLAVTASVALGFIALAWATVLLATVSGNALRGTLGGDGLTVALGVDLAAAILVTWGAAVVYAVVAVALGIWTRSAAAAIAIPLGVLLLEPLGAAGLAAIGGIADLAANFTLSHNIDALLAANGSIHGVDEDLSGYPPAWRGGAFLLLFSAITAWLAARTLQRRDMDE